MSNIENSQEKRRFQRVNTKGLEVQVALPAMFPNWYDVESKDFTREGLSFLSYEKEDEEAFLELGQVIFVRLKVSHTTVPQQHEIPKLQARIANKHFVKNEKQEHGYYRYGVQFMLGEGKKKEKYIASLGRIEGVLSRINTYL